MKFREWMAPMGLAMIASAGAAVFSVANAQTPANSARAAASEELAEVTVTGSRVITNGNDSPNPVTVVTMEDLAATHPTTVFEALNDLPVFASSRTSLALPNNAGGNNSAISALNLRGLGVPRTLVLYDGHRVPPTNQDGLIDVNTIPQMLLQRVDVVTGGVSAVYGSDAITGVVNFITDRKFNGLKATVQGGISQLKDDRSYELGIAFGTDLSGGRGHFEGSYQLHDDGGILHRTDRRLGQGQVTVQGNGSAALPFFTVEGARISTSSFGGKILGPAANPLINQNFTTNGVLTPFVNGSTAGVTSGIQIGGDGAWISAASLKAKQGMHQLYGRFDFDLTDATHFYLTTSGSLGHSYLYQGNNQLVGATMSATNAFLAPAYQQQMTSRSIASFTIGKTWPENIVPPLAPEFFTRQLYVNTGLEGKFGQGYKWETSFTHSITKQTSYQTGNVDNTRLSAALDAVVNPANGQVVCNVTLTNPGLYPGCVPLNVFGPTSESADAVNYIHNRTEFRGKTTMDDLSGSVTGAPFSTWAGPINMAVSAEWRRLGFELSSDAQPIQTDPVSCTGLRFNCTATTSRFVQVQANRTPVHMDISEGALEADLPILRDMRFAKAADINTAVRYARYSSAGSPVATIPDSSHIFSATTWKVGLDWHFNDKVTLRSTRSRDFRAPNLNDLYQPGSIVNNSFVDLLTSLAPTVPYQSGGNPNLLPEVSYTSTLGLVVQPTDKLSLAVDGFDITVQNAILAVNGGQNNIQQACYDSGGTSFYCTMQERPLGFSRTSANQAAANAVTKWYTRALNIAAQRSWGADFEANYKTILASHPLLLRGLITYQPHIIYAQPGVVTFDQGGVDTNNGGVQATPVWRVTAIAHYNPTEALTIDWQTRWRSRLHKDAEDDLLFVDKFVPSVSFTNLNLSYRIESGVAGQADVYLNIQNLFNQLPPLTAFSGQQPGPGRFGGFALGDDPIGRYYMVGLRYRH